VSDSNTCYAQTGLASDQFNGTLSTYNEDCGYAETYESRDLVSIVIDSLAEMGSAFVVLMGAIVAFLVIDFGLKRFVGGKK
jgi:hypothetical protein